jgi:hypothetical protein
VGLKPATNNQMKGLTMNLGDIKKSNYLKKEDVGQGQLMTIVAVKQENVAKEGADPEYKAVAHFAESDKGMVLNSTNAQVIANLTGHSEDIDVNWIGYQVVLYNDPNVQYAGKIIGGIRIRAPKQGMKKLAADQINKMPKPENDGLPF